MAEVYDNWERLVRATLRREQLRLTALRTPSDLSSVSLSSASPSFNFSSNYHRVSSCNFWSLSVGDSFTYHQILKATDFLSDSNLIKHGHSGDFYHGVLESGIQVVVKKINLSSIDRELHFMSELEICGMVFHSRLIPFLGYCLENGNERFLVYKYMPNKDLSSFLHREIVSDDTGDRQLPSLDWMTRLKIAIGAAEGLCYLHHECFPPLVHRDIQASSILLDDDFEVRLGSLTKVNIDEKDSNQNRIAKFLRLPKGFEQRASGASNSTCAYDVFCFGKLLLELVSGKPGTTAANDSTKKDRKANFLQYHVLENKKLVLKIVDPSLLFDEHLLVEVWAVALIARACLSPKPSKRPQMAEILKALEYIKSASFNNENDAGHPNSVSQVPSMTKVPEGSKIMGWILQATTNATSSGSSTSSGNRGLPEASGSENIYQNGNILTKPSLRIFTYSELKDATRNFRFDTKLGEDKCGWLYKGSLHEKSNSKSESESLIAVKWVHSSQYGQSKIEQLGRLSHPNLVKLLGYCLKNEDLLLVYELMQGGSLHSHLLARLGGSGFQLPWAIRLKVLIGAARGLAFLHKTGKQGFFYQKHEGEGFYQYFEPSKILLDAEYNAKISGFEVATVDPPEIELDEPHPIKYQLGRYVYAAPEYIEWFYSKGDCLLKSDVYGFGVLLVQMLTGVDVYGSSFMKSGSPFFKRYYVADKKELGKAVDPQLIGQCTTNASETIAQLAAQCLLYEPEKRPSMEEIVDILKTIDS